MKRDRLALLGGTKTVNRPAPKDLFEWPVITNEDERAVLDVLRRRAMSGTDVTMQFEREFAAWMGVKYALGTSSGTAAVHSAMFGCGIGVGDEIICPSITYWASCLQCFSLGATVVFADSDPVTLCIDPKDIERHISPKTKAIVVVHYLGYPADMDAILRIARRHHLKVIEDVSHAHGALYKGRKVGTFGDVAAYSLMSGKSLAAGEAGMLTTHSREIYERAMAFGHYERYKKGVFTKSLIPYMGLPLGGYKYRMHQMSAAVGRVQLKHYDRRIAKIQKAMNYFWDLLDGVPGVRAHRPALDSGSTKGGWYAPHGLYVPEELHGLSVARFTQAVAAEGCSCHPGGNKPLHLHPLLNKADVYGHGKPTRLANATRDLRQKLGSLPVAEGINQRIFSTPWFKAHRPEIIRLYAQAIRKVVDRHESLLKDDPGSAPAAGGWGLFHQGA